MRYRYIVLMISLCLAGCWDERLLKNLAAVTIVGADGVNGDITGYYVYNEATAPNQGTLIVEAHGLSARDVRQKAEQKVEQTLDLSMLSTFLMTTTSAKEDVYEFIDIYYRDPLNPMTSKIAIVEGEMRPYLEITEAWKMEAGEYYKSFIKSLEEDSLVIPYTIQTAGLALYDEDRDLALPYIKIDEKSGKPELGGLALFTERSFNGTVLPPKDSLYLSVLNDSLGRVTRLTYMYEEKYPLSLRIIGSNRDMMIKDEGISINFDLKVSIDEFPHNELYKETMRDELESFLQEQFTEDLSRVMELLQDKQSDVLGLGNKVRAYENSLYSQPWRDVYATLPIKIEANVSIDQTGILY